MKKYNVLELFAGAGGLALGLEQAGFNTVGLIEIDRFAVDTLRKNRPHWNIIHKDIIDVVEKDIKNFIKIKDEIDLVSGGFPCQPFSYAGKKLGLNDTRGTLVYYFAEVLKSLKPKSFLAENVKGLLNHNNGQTFKTILNIFENIGYKLSWKVMNALDYGVPQKRQRLVLVGIRNDLYTKSFLFPDKDDKQLTLKDALLNVPNSVGAKYSDKKKAILSLVPAGGYWKHLPIEIAKKYMGKSYFLSGGKTGIARRISWDEPSLTLTCSPVQMQTERCHPEEVRPFTTREYARIQTFPDDWEFSGSCHNIYKQIGNAVPVNLAKRIGQALIII